MKKILCSLSLAFLAVCGMTSNAAAQFQERGSDTLEIFARGLINACGLDSTLVYIDGGSGAGQTALVNGTQSVAPMSRLLDGAACTSPGGPQECMIVARDGVTIYAPGNCADCEAGGVANIATNTLRTIYGGTDGTGAQAPCAAAARQTLAASWAEVVTGETGTCESGNCALYHAYRRDDVSGTTGVFKTMVGVTNFCNGLSSATRVEDADPIRRSCKASDVVCGMYHTLGLVLPIQMPVLLPGEEGGLPFPPCTRQCSTGYFRGAPAHSAVVNGVTVYNCPEFGIRTFPDATARRPNFAFGTACSAPAMRDNPQDTTPEFDCINPRTNTSAFLGAQNDGGIFNTFVRRRNGQLLTTAAPGMFYRATACNGCQELSATTQIACLARNDNCTADATTPVTDAARGCANPANCPTYGRSIGFAGARGEVDVPGATRLTLGGVCPTQANLQVGGSYPGSRDLYICATLGLSGASASTLTDNVLADCLLGANASTAIAAGVNEPGSGVFPTPQAGTIVDGCP